MNTNSDDLNDRDGHLNKNEESGARFNSDAQKHAIEAMEEDEAIRLQQQGNKPQEHNGEDPIESYGL